MGRDDGKVLGKQFRENRMGSVPVLIDCDPGVDDAIALLLAIAAPELNILGITTVAGNVPLYIAQTNALYICELANGGLANSELANNGLANRPDIPVYGGCPGPLLRSPVFAMDIHGKSGLGTLERPEPQMILQAQHGVNFLIETLLLAPQPLTVVALGPLTNVAIALILEPRIKDCIRELVIMGGAIGSGNITPEAEFNFFADPHAAQRVFSCGIPITLIGLDVTQQAIATPDRQARINALDTPVSWAVLQMLEGYDTSDEKQAKKTDSSTHTNELNQPIFTGPPLHDPCVIAYLLNPTLFEFQWAYITIETYDALRLGRSEIRLLKDGLQTSANARVAIALDVDGFYDLLIKGLSHYRV